MYGSAQQSPYLQVALPLIEDVKGGEGLGSLWRVFTKCQSSIQDGSRLENISWRLWYKSLHPSAPSAGSSPTSAGGLRAMAHRDPPFGDRSRQPHHGRRPSIAGSSFTESVASSSVESDLSDRDFFPPLAPHPPSAAGNGAGDAAATDLVASDEVGRQPTETHSEPITPSLPPLGPVVSAATASPSAVAGPSTRRPMRPSMATVPQHASTGDLASIDGLANSSGGRNADGPSARADGSSVPRPALAARAKSTPRLQSSSPYETPAPRPLRPPPRPLDELGSAGISFGRVLGHVYKEGTVRSIARRPQQQTQPQSQPPVKAPQPPSPPKAAPTPTSASDGKSSATDVSPPRPTSVPRTVVAPMSAASSDGVRSSEPSARNSLSSSGGHGHFLGRGGPSIRVLEPTPANTTPSSPAPRAHATLWGSDEDGGEPVAGALDGFSFTQSFAGSQERTPQPTIGTLNLSSSGGDLNPSLEPVARSPLSTSSSDTLGSMTSSALSLNLPGRQQPSQQEPHQRPIPAAGRAGGHVNPPGSTPATEGKKLFFISPDNGEGSGSCSSLDSDSTRPSPPPPTSPKASTSIDVGEQTIGSPESLEDGGLQMRRRGKSPMRAASAKTVSAPTSSGSPPRPVVSPSYAPLASSPLKHTSTLPPRQAAPRPAVARPAEPPVTSAAAATAGGWESDDGDDVNDVEEQEEQRPKPPVRQQSTSSTASSASRRKGSAGSTKVGPSSKAALAGRRRSVPSRPSSAAMAMTKSNEGVAKANGAMAPPPTLTRAAASEPITPAPTTARRASADPTPTGRFSQEQAKAASAIAAATGPNSSTVAPREKLISVGPALAPPNAKSGSSSRNGATRPPLNGRRTSSSKLSITDSRTKTAPPTTGADAASDDDGSGSYETDSGGETAAGSGGDGEWASDSASSGAPSPAAVGGKQAKAAAAPPPTGTTSLAPPGRRSSAAAAARSKATRYTAAAVERARQEAAVRFAEEEAERQKSLFRKVPVSKSAADLYGLGREALASSNSAVPARAETVAPDGSRSGTGNIAGGRSSGLLSDMFKVEREKREGVYQRAGHSSSQDLWQHGRDAATASSSRTPSAMLPRNKSTAALPQASGFTVCRGEELESESETDAPGSGDNKVTIGSSEAQRRLAVLSAKKSATTTPRHHGLSAMTTMTPVGAATSAITDATTATEPHQQHMKYPPTTRPLPPRPDVAPMIESPQPLEDDSTLPPLAAAPQSPRTTRRQMLAAELPEELRKQLLWERMSRQRVYGGGTINRSNSTPKLTAEALAQDHRPAVQRNAATESAPASRAPSDSSSPPPPAPPTLKRNSGILGGGGLLRPLTSSAGLSPPAVTHSGQRERSSSDAPAPNNGSAGIQQQSNPYLEKVKASRKSTDGPLQAYRSNPSSTNLVRLNAQQPPSSESSSDSDDEEDALTLLKRRNTHHGELSKLGNDGWDADYRSHGF